MSLQRYQVSIVCATPEAVNAHLERCDEGAVCVASEVATLEAEVAALREALEFYGDSHNHGSRNDAASGEWRQSAIREDGGQRARKALEGEL